MLGKWALIDIETTGIDPAQDHVIDIGFILYENQTFLAEHSVRFFYDKAIDPVIISLTGLCVPELQKNGLSWENAKEIFKILNDVVLIGHNASFEESFLKSIFSEYGIYPKQTDHGDFFHDSLEVIPFLLPYFPRLGLESINQIFNLEPKEEHQGLSDSKDLLKALMYSHKLSGDAARREIASLQCISSWWKNWLLFSFDYQVFKLAKKEESNTSFKEITKWEQTHLLNYSKQFNNTDLEWLSLKSIQMLGRQISGIISPKLATEWDLQVITDIAKNYIKNFPLRKLCICTCFYSPDEMNWFLEDKNIISLDNMACVEFKSFSEEYSTLLNKDDNLWSKSLLKFYARSTHRFGPGSRVPDLWCRKDPHIELLWNACKELVRQKVLNDPKIFQGKLLILNPSDINILKNSNDCSYIFWNAKQLEWNSDLFVKKLKNSDIDQVFLVCDLLKMIDPENTPTIDSCCELLLQFNNSLKEFITISQQQDKKKIYWDFDFTTFSKRYLSHWEKHAQNFLKRRQLLKNIQMPLINLFWNMVDKLIIQLIEACQSDNYGLSWKLQTEKISWEIWKEVLGLEKVQGCKLFFDYEFSPHTINYWESVLGLSALEKSKRFEKIQTPVPIDEISANQFEISIIEDSQVQKLHSEILESIDAGPVLFYGQDLTLSTNLYSYFKKENSLNICTWSQFLRSENKQDYKVIFCWDKEVRIAPLCKNVKYSFNRIFIDRVNDLPWFAWAQTIWKKRVELFDCSSFDAYWLRRSSLLREKFFPIARVLQVKELCIFDSRKSKWKGDSWKILKGHLESM